MKTPDGMDILVKHPATANYRTKTGGQVRQRQPERCVDRSRRRRLQQIARRYQTTLRHYSATKSSSPPAAYRAKIKTPFELAVSAIRSLAPKRMAAGHHRNMKKLGEVPYGYQAPTGYPDTAATG